MIYEQNCKRMHIPIDHITPSDNEAQPPRYLKYVSPEKADDLYEQILDILVIKKRYRDCQYSARKLADDLGTNTRYISIVLNTRFHANYNTVVNKLRIDFARSILTDKRYQDLKMEDIASLSGFSNRQSFYTAFNRFAKMSPVEYRKKNNW